MSGRLLGLAVTAAVTTGSLLAPVHVAAAAPPPPGEQSVSALLTRLQGLYRNAEEATESYNAAEERLKKQRTGTELLGDRLAAARDSLRDSRSAAGRLARAQYQRDSGQYTPYLRMLMADDPRRALDVGHMIQRVARHRVNTVDRLARDERRRGELASAARKALAEKQRLAARQKSARDTVRDRLGEVEELLAGLSPGQIAQLAQLEQDGTAQAQRTFMASGALSHYRPPSARGARALEYAVAQIGKPYVWGAQGPDTYDCSGLTSQAWGRAGRRIPRTSQEQWATLPHVPLTELRPGDLVVYFPEATHVAVYLGDGQVVQAPRPGAKVKVSPVAANPVLGAVRPDPDAGPVPGWEPPRLPAGATAGDDTGYAGVGAPPRPKASG
ncbi:C40 family peptidase [Streptomyces tsukubensis]|uniref:NlpC/P60 domain-containing protein n=1 Tax=Streptomyces tsukubensis TaxID=83656 RepID=A0A1V4ABE1_9ACTN|nr:C40 family peptidase [Streptomyces tsukubensis]OON81186.1 hypothetical protein B1H18_07405 [Streptomyces tsukubensis]QFR98012.1 hypothetical protein GBW32_25050 [Streptomyces tsukubensis]